MIRYRGHKDEQGVVSISDKNKSFQGLSLSVVDSTKNRQCPCCVAGTTDRETQRTGTKPSEVGGAS